MIFYIFLSSKSVRSLLRLLNSISQAIVLNSLYSFLIKLIISLLSWESILDKVLRNSSSHFCSASVNLFTRFFRNSSSLCSIVDSLVLRDNVCSFNSAVSVSMELVKTVKLFDS
ncbi:MAG: hypothetical protein OdinLCB4_006270 [Candidatus Odinarchaeum yellowstonii]|uniref:Uncharacterized protein n=1 Tax=Odinarchaeota yellowstonii (strain LCB_4) TaxID=1841599 RepID=A0AAF0D1N7_ODILC|nr:MAG: hypothetical protein OdinLCB4_006270 [Candidatus Odinarchaeum yellowstonii]